MHIKNKHAIILIAILLVFFLVEDFYLWGLPRLFNSEKSINKIEQIFEGKTKADLSIDNLKFNTYGDFSFSLSADKLIVLTQDGKKILNTDKLFIRTYIIPLLWKHFDIKAMSADYFDLDVVRYKNGKYNFEDIFFKSAKDKLHLKMKNTKFNLAKYNLNFKDNMLGKDIKLKGNYFKVAQFTLGKNIDIDTQGTLSTPKDDTKYHIKINTELPLKEHIDDSKFVISGFITDFRPHYFSPYINKLVKNDIEDVLGDISLNFYTKKQTSTSGSKEIFIEGVINNLLVKKEQSEDNISLAGKSVISSKFNLTRDKLEIVEAKFDADKLHCLLHGIVKNYKSKKPTLDINLAVKKSRIEKIVNLLPSNLIPNRDEIKKIKHYKVRGDLDVDLLVEGKIPQPNILGFINLDNVHILNGLDSRHSATAKLSFNKRILDSKATFSFPNNQNIKIKGKTYIYQDKINTTVITSTKSLDLKLVHKLLLPIRDVFGFKLGPLPNMEIYKGLGSLKLNIAGTVESSEVKGFVKFKGAKSSYNGINAYFDNVDGDVDFQGKVIKYKTDKAYLKGVPVFLKGTSLVKENVDINVGSKSIDSKILWDVLTTSPLLDKMSKKLVIIDKISGSTSFVLNMKAKINGISTLDSKSLLDNMNFKGELGFKNAFCYLKDYELPISRIKGKVEFTDNTSKLTNLAGMIGSSPVTIFGNLVNNPETNIPSVDISVCSDKVDLADTLKFIAYSNLPSKVNLKDFDLESLGAFHSLIFNYKTDSASSKVNMDDISFTAKFLPLQIDPDKNIKINSGLLIMDEGNLDVENLVSDIYGSKIKLAGDFKDIYKSKPSYSLCVDADEFNLAFLNDSLKLGYLPKNIQKTLLMYSDFSGLADIHLNSAKNLTKGSLVLNDVKFVHKVSQAPVEIEKATFDFSPDKISAKSLNAKVGDSPLFGDFELTNISKKPYLKASFTTKLTDAFMNNYVNNKLSYPIKVKGDITLNSEVFGTLTNYRIKPILKLNEGSDIIYMSSKIGNPSSDREITADISVSPEKININKFNYLKYMQSQNAKVYPMNFASVTGNLVKYNDKFIPTLLKIKTDNPMPARLLNLVFKKAILKRGNFNCDLVIKMNPKENIPRIFGNIDFRSINIPLYDTVIRDISLKSDRGLINVEATGSIFDSDFSVASIIENKLVYPLNFKKLDIVSNEFNFDRLLNTLGEVGIDTYQDTNSQKPVDIDVSKFVVKDGHMIAKKVLFKSLPANDLTSDFTLNENSELKFDGLNIKIAGGSVKGSGEYNFKTTKIDADLIANGVDSYDMADALFDMKNQIYGDMNGQIYLSSQGTTRDERMRNLSGLVYFNITDGRMPKLGSLEYLLRASNLLKSGLTGLTINSIIDLINPIRTGHFSKINGNFMMYNGVAKNIEIFSKGENLSIYVKGKYDMVASEADMTVLGKLSKKIPTLLGPIGNASINTLFNFIPGIFLTDSDETIYLKDVSKIPDLSVNNDDYRVFEADIDGNINGDDYVSSFAWVE